MKKNSNPPNREVYGHIAAVPGRHCPFVSDPFNACFIANINSQNIGEAIYYCGSNFEDCEIYRKAEKQGRT